MEPVTTAALALGKAVTPHALSLIKKIGQQKYDKFVATCTDAFYDHIQTAVEKCSRVKSLLNRDEPLQTKQQYVNIAFSSMQQVIWDHDIIESCRRSRVSFLVSGLAGSGKSMFMKWLTLSLVDEIQKTQKLPLFVELREVEQSLLRLSIDKMIFAVTSSDSSSATFGQFHVGLQEGMFIILLDGLDEVPLDFRDSILLEVSDFQRRFPYASIVCSTRPNMLIESSAGLRTLHVLKMSLEQICEVIDNAPYELNKKLAFVDKLRDGLYDQHQSFLSNPLLAIIMLITFDLSTAVPTRLSLFYSQVYEALYYKHDSSKGVYKREHYAGLEIDQFEAAFRSFAFRSYAESKLSFEMSDLTNAVRKALTQAQLSEVSPADFIKDCLYSLSLMKEDGLYVSFVHRSFQEYFAARFLLYYVGEHYFALVNGIARRCLFDSTLKMLCEMNADAVLKGWVLPKLDEMIDRLEELDLHDRETVLNQVMFYASNLSVDYVTGYIDTWAWSSSRASAEVHGIEQALEAAGIQANISPLHGSFVRPRVKGSRVPPDEYVLNQLQLILRSLEFTAGGVISVPVSKDAGQWIMYSNLPGLIGAHLRALKSLRSEVESRFSTSDDFAAKVASIF